MIESNTSAYFDENQYSAIVTLDQYDITEMKDEIALSSFILPPKTYRVIAGKLFIIEPGAPPDI
jgi:hypothetical protein